MPPTAGRPNERYPAASSGVSFVLPWNCIRGLIPFNRPKERGIKPLSTNNARVARGCLTALLAASAVLFLVLMFATAYIFVFEPQQSMERMQRAIPQALETFERSREHLDTLAYGEFAQSDVRFRRDNLILRDEGRHAIWPSSMERLEGFPDEERDAVLFLMTDEGLGEGGFLRVSGRDGVIRALLYSRPPGGGTNSDGMEITRGGGPTETALLARTYVMDLGEGYALWLYVRRCFGLAKALVAFPGIIAGIATLLLSLILRRARRKREANAAGGEVRAK